MFSWLSLASGLVKLFNAVAGAWRDAKLQKAGRDEERGRMSEIELARIAKANRARVPGYLGANRERLRDKYTRDN